jgi:hypothetical protein
MKTLLLFVLVIFFTITIFAQKLTFDTTIATQNYLTAKFVNF